jgi:hypothetical protein
MLQQAVNSIMAKVAGKSKRQKALIVPFFWQSVGRVEVVRHFSVSNEQQALISRP